MTTFILKSKDEQIDIHAFSSGHLKGSFSELQASITAQLQSLKCNLHHHDPIIILQSDRHKVCLAGISTCCSEFAGIVRDLLKLPVDIMGADVEVTTRTYTYTYYS